MSDRTIRIHTPANPADDHWLKRLFLDAFGPTQAATRGTQDDYTLAGPSKGTAE